MRVFLVALLVLLTPMRAFAWGQTGHRVTGAIAEPLLSRRAAREVRALIGNESLAEASTWADDMRSSPEEFWQRTASPWHYVTVPPGLTYADVGAPAEGDAITALTLFAATLRNRALPLEERQLALRFAIHIIGDLHQPLHVGNGADRGGNDVQVSFFSDRTNLHAVWDSGMIDRRQLSYTEWTDRLGRRITPSLRREWSDPDPLVWVAESAAIRDTIYPEGDRLSFDYIFEHRDTVDVRLSQAGVRIAVYLNWVF